MIEADEKLLWNCTTLIAVQTISFLRSIFMSITVTVVLCLSTRFGFESILKGKELNDCKIYSKSKYMWNLSRKKMQNLKSYQRLDFLGFTSNVQWPVREIFSPSF